jgi:hypothetical protein
MVTNQDIAALANLIRYSEEEAVRLRMHEAVIQCLRMAGLAMAGKTPKETPDDGTGDVKVA